MPHFDGIVFTVSKAEVPCYVIDQLKPRRIALICTPASQAHAEEIRAHAQKQGALVDSIHQIQDPDSTQETRHATRHLLEQMRQSNCEALAVDVTGGKTPMSLGAFMAAEETGATSLYVATHSGPNLKQPDMRSAKIVTVSTPNQ